MKVVDLRRNFAALFFFLLAVLLDQLLLRGAEVCRRNQHFRARGNGATVVDVVGGKLRNKSRGGAVSMFGSDE